MATALAKVLLLWIKQLCLVMFMCSTYYNIMYNIQSKHDLESTAKSMIQVTTSGAWYVRRPQIYVSYFQCIFWSYLGMIFPYPYVHLHLSKMLFFTFLWLMFLGFILCCPGELNIRDCRKILQSWHVSDTLIFHASEVVSECVPDEDEKDISEDISQ